ncbi:MAG: CvpA family protein [Anaerolineae bacterium]|jgi:hypothetical protein
MMPLETVFLGLILLFGIIGLMRGWVKEVLVSVGVLLALFVQQIIGQYILGPANRYLPILLDVPPDVSAPGQYTSVQFYASSILLLVLTIFGYAGPTLVARAGGKVARERVQDAILGLIIGLINGYLIIGTLWFYLDKFGYVIGGIQGPAEGSTGLIIVNTYLMPVWLSTPMLYLGIAITFVLIIVLFI